MHPNHQTTQTAPTLFIWGLLVFLCLMPSMAMAQLPQKSSRFWSYFRPSPNPYKGRIVPVPLLIYGPETSIGFGISSQYLFRTASTDSTGNLSTTGLTFLFTLRKQFILNPNWDVFWKRQQYRMTGAVVWQRYPDSFYGLGNQTLRGADERFSGDYLLVRNRFTRMVLPNLLLGAQYRLEHMYNLKTEENGLFEKDVPGADGFTASGLGVAMIFDSRDHNLYPFRGWYVILSHHLYSRYFGGNTDLSSLRLDVRKYWNPGKGSHILALQAVAQVHSNPPPFKMMSTFGGNELMRGYFFGRFRDLHMYALHAEYRFPLFWRFIGVAFAAAGNTAGPYSSGGFNNLKFASGAGLRFTLDAKERINVRFDAGFGLDGSRGFYLAIGEAF